MTFTQICRHCVSVPFYGANVPPVRGIPVAGTALPLPARRRQRPHVRQHKLKVVDGKLVDPQGRGLDWKDVLADLRAAVPHLLPAPKHEGPSLDADLMRAWFRSRQSARSR